MRGFSTWSDAKLTWTSTGSRVKVLGFGIPLELPSADKQSMWTRAWQFFKSEQLRAPPSMANPSQLVGRQIASEDDVRSVKVDRLDGRDAEILVAILTVPCTPFPQLRRG